jgi:SAM-dependent methyltransferase
MKANKCHVCSSGDLYEHEGYRSLMRVTSDCKPWKPGGGLCTCRNCGCTQAVCDQDWRESIEFIYAGYDIYYQGGGEEQKVFDSATGRTLPRSEWLLERISQHARLRLCGRALDVGCGNGRFLKAFGSAYPDWRLSGTEFNAKYRATVESLPGVEHFFTGPLSKVPGDFDLVFLIHVLEHIEDPIPFLSEVGTKLSANGLLFVELPSYESNPFELLIIDHATHYTLAAAAWALSQAGFKSLVSNDTWVVKELSFLAKRGAAELPVPKVSLERVEETIRWLQLVAKTAREMSSKGGPFGIFGTSIAATWLTAELGDPPSFFVDEDVNRIGHLHLGVPIVSPAQVSTGSTVFVAQPIPIARLIADRLRRDDVSYTYATSQ